MEISIFVTVISIVISVASMGSAIWAGISRKLGSLESKVEMLVTSDMDKKESYKDICKLLEEHSIKITEHDVRLRHIEDI